MNMNNVRPESEELLPEFEDRHEIADLFQRSIARFGEGKRQTERIRIYILIILINFLIEFTQTKNKDLMPSKSKGLCPFHGVGTSAIGEKEDFHFL